MKPKKNISYIKQIKTDKNYKYTIQAPKKEQCS